MNIIIVGTGKQAELVHYSFTHDTENEVVAFGVDTAYLDSENPTLLGLPIVDTNDLIKQYPAATCLAHVALGQNERRASSFYALQTAGYNFVNYICSKASTWSDLQLGSNVFIDQGSRIHPLVTVGDNTTLVGTDVGHHAIVGSHILASCAIIGAKSIIGDGSYLGLGCIIREGVRIGKNNLIGAGAYISQDTEDDAVYSGPASRKRAVTASRVSFFKK